MEYKPTIGLEIHVELNTKSKMFCSCKNDPDETRANFNICPICMGHPGTLPVINKDAVRRVIKTGLALNSQIPEYSKFDRKNYFYPDLPKGYQISQYDKPLCVGGYLNVEGSKIRIRRVHLEEDTARLIHEEKASLVDFNRAGVPLMELVTEPDIKSAKEAREFAQELKLILRYLDVSDADMEKGQMRIEVNISLQSSGGKIKDKKVEIKNLNSFKSVERAVDYEIKRQSKLLDSKKEIIQETMGWDDIKEETFSQREKEEAHDYRYFPEPDLPPLTFSKEEINEIRAEVPELSQQKRERLIKEYSLERNIADIFVENKKFGEYFEKVVSEFDAKLSREKLIRLIKLATNYLVTDLQGMANTQGIVIGEGDFKISPEDFAEFISLIEKGKISSKIAKIVLEEMLRSGADPSNIIQEKGLTQISDDFEIERVIANIISQNPKVVEEYKKGKTNALQFLIGQIMAETKGKANPQKVRDILSRELEK